MVGYVVEKPLCQFISVVGWELEDEEATVMGYAGMDLVDDWGCGLGTYEPHDEVCFRYFT